MLGATDDEPPIPQGSVSLSGAPGIIDLTRQYLIRLHKLGKLASLVAKMRSAPIVYTTLCSGADVDEGHVSMPSTSSSKLVQTHPGPVPSPLNYSGHADARNPCDCSPAGCPFQALSVVRIRKFSLHTVSVRFLRLGDLGLIVAM